MKNAGNNTAAKKTLDELFLALQAVRRLDMSANLFLLEAGKRQTVVTITQQITQMGDTIFTAGSDCSQTKMSTDIQLDGYSGFFYRSDQPWGFDLGTVTGFSTPGGSHSAYVGLVERYVADGNKFIPHSNYGQDKVGDFTSADQLYGLIQGLSVAKTLIAPATTPEEIKVIDTIDKMLAGYIAEGLSKLDLKGCFKDKFKVQGPNTLKYAAKLMDIARQFGLEDEVNKKTDVNLDWKSAISSFLNFDEFYNYVDCLPNNYFQTNHYTKLFSINYKDGDNTAAQTINAFRDAMENTWENSKIANGLVGFIMAEPTVVKNFGSDYLKDHCNMMEDWLNKMPCCGPSANMLFSPPCGSIWTFESTNDDYYPNCKPKYDCDEKSKKIFNGVDYMMDFNLMLLACQKDKVGNFTVANNNIPSPTTIKPEPLQTINGCEDDKLFLHIQGPEEVCAGQSTTFNLSTFEHFTPNVEPYWSLDNSIQKDSRNPLTREQFKKADKSIDEAALVKFMNKDIMSIPSTWVAGSKHTISFTYILWSSGIPLTKTVKKK